MLRPIYLDYMATTPIDPRVKEKMLPFLGSISDGIFGNPASKHYYGYQAKAAIEEARTQVATLINCDWQNIIWTSGATEANNLAIKGIGYFYQRQGKHIITCKTEHKSVLDPCRYLESQGFEITYLTPDQDGLITLQQVKQALRPDTILVSIMHVNNEIGVIQDIAKISELTLAKGVLLHVDAVQSAGKIPIDLQKLKVDLMSFSSHKIYGPKGVGALYVRPKLHLVSQSHGGAQENGLRAGTLATHQIVGMGEACKIAAQEMIKENNFFHYLREKLWEGIKNLENIRINGSMTHRIANNLNISFANIDSDILLAALKDIAVSSSSACMQDTGTSYVLKAIGVPENLAQNSIRISLGRFTTEKEIETTIKHINEVVIALT